jgi:hypothetical protein
MLLTGLAGIVRIQLSVQRFEFAMTLHLLEFLLRLEQVSGSPVCEAVALLPALYIARYGPHGRMERLDDVRARKAGAQQRACFTTWAT